MRLSEEAELQRHTLWLYAGDYERLRGLFPDVPTAIVIRRLIRAHIEAVEGKKSTVKISVEI